MNKLILILFILPLVSFAETKYEIAREILNANEEYRESINTIEPNVNEQRELAIKAYVGTIEIEDLPQDIIALKEQLQIDIVTSDLFKLDKAEFESVMVNEFTNELTYEELIELRELYKRPIFKKLAKINKKIIISSNSFVNKWQEHNTELGNKFAKRAKEINNMTIDYLKSKPEPTP